MVGKWRVEDNYWLQGLKCVWGVCVRGREREKKRERERQTESLVLAYFSKILHFLQDLYIEKITFSLFHPVFVLYSLMRVTYIFFSYLYPDDIQNDFTSLKQFYTNGLTKHQQRTNLKPQGLWVPSHSSLACALPEHHPGKWSLAPVSQLSRGHPISFRQLKSPCCLKKNDNACKKS